MTTPMRSASTFLPQLALAVLLLAPATPAAAQSSDAALSGLTVAGSSDGTSYSGITLSPAFAAGMGSSTPPSWRTLSRR